MELFPSLKKSLESSELSREHSSELMTPIFRSVEYQISTIVEKITNINTLNEEEIKSIIVRQHQTILNYDLFLASDESRGYVQKLFTNKRFLQIFLQVIGFLQLPYDEIVCINKLAYDYYIIPGKDPEISDLLLQISYQINNILVIRLSGKLGINGARVLSMIANSSFKEEKNVHRINTFLVKYGELSVQDIVDIYCILFERFTYPFIFSMLESKPSGLSKSQLICFDNISLALLSILDSMTSEDIKRVLYDYAFTLKLIRNDFSVRFSLKSAKAYTRIQEVIKEIELDPIDTLIIP